MSMADGRIRPILAFLVALAVGLAVAIDPLIGVAAGATVLAAVGLMLVSGRLVDVALGALALLLVGYALMGRGFAYFGVAPLFIGEIVLGLVIVAWLRGPRARYVGLGPVPLLLVAFMAWGAVATIPFLGIHGLNAVRDLSLIHI